MDDHDDFHGPCGSRVGKSEPTIGAVAGCFSASTAFFWAWANWSGKLPEPVLAGVEPEEIEVHGDPVM